MSKAEKLAGMLEKIIIIDEIGSNNPLAKNAAIELRRLAAENAALQTAFDVATKDCRNLTEKVIPNLRDENAVLRKDAERWQQVAYMEASRVDPETLAHYIARPERLDYAAELRKHNNVDNKER